MIPKYVREYVDRAKMDDLNELFALANLRYNHILEGIAVSIKPGEKVSFESKKRGGRVYGTVLKANKKSIKIRTDDGEFWRVAPTLIRKE